MTSCDFLIISRGPAGHKAAIQGAKAGKTVILVDREPAVGGMCVHKGTIPSKAMRESALRHRQARELLNVEQPTELKPLMKMVDSVIAAHDSYISDQLTRNGIHCIRGKARFEGINTVKITEPGGQEWLIEAKDIFVATGSKPRHPPNINIDHESVVDSDSFLVVNYLPKSLIVIGGGVIACEYASVFANLGCEVTLVDRFAMPLGFLDEDLPKHFLSVFQELGGVFIGNTNVKSADNDGISGAEVVLEDGSIMWTEKVLVAQGRVSNLTELNLEITGVEVSDLGLIKANENCQTNISHIYAIGDVIGPPPLASAAMEQGRKAACHALGKSRDELLSKFIPAGIYAIPETASVGMTEAAAVEQYGTPVIGRAEFNEVARGLIMGGEEGMVKIISDAEGDKLVGMHIVGEGATELIHMAQVALTNKASISSFVDQIFNFPTLVEAFRAAALDIQGQLVEDVARSSTREALVRALYCFYEQV
jgi:NAD(P) transhydrogenase